MNWVSFFLGAFVGFIAEWVVDLFYWRRQHGQKTAELEAAREEMRDLDARYQESLRAASVAQREMEAAKASMATTTNELSALKEQLAAAQAAGEAAAAQLAECQEHLQANEADVAQLSARVGAADETIAALQAELATAQAEVAALAQKLAQMEGEGAAAMESTRMPTETLVEATAPSPPDDLSIIEGIGAKIAGVLQNAGIHTFAQLAATDVSRLETILAEAGPRFQLAEPASWPQQAALAAAGSWDELQQLQDALKGGHGVRGDVQPL